MLCLISVHIGVQQNSKRNVLCEKFVRYAVALQSGIALSSLGPVA